MADKKPAKGLGRGINALLPETPVFLNQDQDSREHVMLLAISSVEPNPDQPRRVFDAEKISELSKSILEHGLLQPLIVLSPVEGQHRIIAGERRWRAAKEAGLKEIPCIVRTLQEQQVRELSLIENIQREDLLPLEEALAFRNLMDQYGFTQELLAERLSKSRSHIANTLRLLTLAPQYQEMLQQGTLSAGHARAILSLEDKAQQAKLAEQIVREGWSVRQAEQWVKDSKQAEGAERLSSAAKPTVAAKPVDPIYLDIARKLKDKWGVKVSVNDKKGRGQIVIDYYSVDDLQRILDSLLEESL